MPLKNNNIHPSTKIYQPTLSNIYNSKIGRNSSIGAFTEIGGAEVGENCKIQAHVFICPGVKIGNNVFIGPGVRFTNDKYPSATGEWELLETTVEDEVSIGCGAIILPGLRIGKGAVVGAGSVVTRDILPGAVMVGSPGRDIKKGA